MSNGFRKDKLSKEKREEMIGKIKDFFLKDRDEEIGDLAAGIYLDFVIEKLSDEFYNQGVLDSYKYLDDHLPDLLEIQKQ
jgi:uncharacterized protein (DUF2164 family)